MSVFSDHLIFSWPTSGNDVLVEPVDDFKPGLEGVVAFRTAIAEPDRDGGSLRYRGVDLEDLAGKVSFGDVWALLVDGHFGQGLAPAESSPIPVHTGDVRVDVQAALTMLAPIWDFQPLLDVSDAVARDQLARASVITLSYVAQAARGIGRPAVPQARIDECATVTERFMTRWRGEPDPRHVKAIEAYWVSAAEHGLNASTFTARVIASTGADVAASLSGAIGAMSGPLHGGPPARVLPMIEEAERVGDARKTVRNILDRGDRLMGFGHRVYRAEDPRARVLRRTCRELGAERYEVAAELEQAALAELRERRPGRKIETNAEFWAAVILDFAQVSPQQMLPMFICARIAGWSAHILEQKQTGRLVRPSARYVGSDPRRPEDVDGWYAIEHSLGTSYWTGRPQVSPDVVSDPSLLQVSIYVGGDDGSDLAHALGALLEMFDLQVAARGVPELGSWFQSIWVKVKKGADNAAVKENAKKLAHAIELRTLERVGAEVDERKSSAIATLLAAVENQEEVLIVVHSIVLIKVGGATYVWSLDEAECALIQRDRTLLRSPRSALQLIHEMREQRNYRTNSNVRETDRVELVERLD